MTKPGWPDGATGLRKPGWPDGATGLRKPGCRPATLFQWIHDHLHQGAGAFCATGNSGGSTQIAYSLSRYGLGEIFDMVAPTSGPPVARLERGCSMCDPATDIEYDSPCGTPATYCLGNAAAAVDTTYGGLPRCSQAGDDDLPFLLNDSAAADDAIYAFPKTDVFGVFGGGDKSAAVAQGLIWFESVTTQVETICVPEAGHPIASSIEGYIALRDALITRCHPQ